MNKVLDYTPHLRTYGVDTAIVVALLWLSPLSAPAIFFDLLTPLQPDAVAYLALSEAISTTGALFLSGWGHIDNALVPPPLYSLFITAGAWLAPEMDPAIVAERLAKGFMLASVIPLYALALTISNRLVATVVTALFVLHPLHLTIGTSALTEPLYIFFSLAGAFGVVQGMRAERYGPAILALAGLGIGLTYLTRQIGVTMYAAAVALFLIELVRGDRGRACVIAGLGWLSLGTVLVVAPYLTAFWSQSDLLPVAQSFRLAQYEVPARPDDPVPQVAPGASGYEAFYASRRASRVLNADATEMVGNVIQPATTAPTPANHARLIMAIHRIGTNLLKNFASLKGVIGVGNLAFLAVVLPVLLILLLRRIMPVGFPLVYALTYLTLISWFSGEIERYLWVLYPFLILLLGAAIHQLASLNPPGVPRRPAQWGAAAVALVATLAFLPVILLAPAPPVGISAAAFAPVSAECRALVTPGTPVMALLPGDAFDLGGNYRILPNDSAERAAAYGKRTGVHLVALSVDSVRQEGPYYTNAHWLNTVFTTPPPALRPLCRDRGLTLFELHPPDLAHPAGRLP